MLLRPRISLLLVLLLLILTGCQPIQRVPQTTSAAPVANLAQIQEANKAIVAAYLNDIFLKGDLTTIEDYIAPDCKIHQAFLGDLSGPEGIRSWATNYWAGFKDPSFTTTLYASGEDVVFVDWSWVATDITNDAKQFKVERAIDFYRLKDGKIIELYDVLDTLTFSQQ